MLYIGIDLGMILRILAKFDRSFSRIHSSFGAVKPAKAMLAV